MGNAAAEAFLVAANLLDVRTLPTWSRHREIFALFDALRPGEELRLLTDHEPRPLRFEFDRQRSGRFVWTQLQRSDSEWHVAIRRVESAGQAASLDDFFSRCSLLTGCAPQTIAAFAGSAIERAVARREAVAEQGTDWPYLGFVQEGTLGMIAASADGRERLLFEYLPFETFAEIAAIDGGTQLGRAAPPFGAARIAGVPRAVVLRQLEADPAFALTMAQICAQRGRLLAERLEVLTGRSATERVARALLPYAAADQGLAPVAGPIRRLSQSQLAVAAGTVREVAARSLFELENAGAIELEGGRVARIDRAKLAEFC